MQHSSSWQTDSSAASQEITRILWNRRCSLPCSWQPAIYPHPDPDQYSPCHSTTFLEDKDFKI